MKKACLVLLALSLVFVAACGTPGPVERSSAPAAASNPNTPAWLNDFPPEDALWGIGSAKQSSDSMSMTTAEARARVAIARQLSTKVQAMFTDYNLDAGSAGSQANASLQEDVSRQVTNMDVSGAKPIKREKTPDGTWWYLVEFKKSDAKTTVAGILNNEQAQYAQFKASQALQMMDAQLAKPEKGTVVEN